MQPCEYWHEQREVSRVTQLLLLARRLLDVDRKNHLDLDLKTQASRRPQVFNRKAADRPRLPMVRFTGLAFQG